MKLRLWQCLELHKSSRHKNFIHKCTTGSMSFLKKNLNLLNFRCMKVQTLKRCAKLFRELITFNVENMYHWVANGLFCGEVQASPGVFSPEPCALYVIYLSILMTGRFCKTQISLERRNAYFAKSSKNWYR